MALDLVKLRAVIALIVRDHGTSQRNNSKCFRFNVTKMQEVRQQCLDDESFIFVFATYSFTKNSG